MKLLLLLPAALLLTAHAALAQAPTVLPSGAVTPAGSAAPSGVIITPGTVPGSQPLQTDPHLDGGSPRAHRRDQEPPGMTREDKKRLRKLGKVRKLPNTGGN